MEEIVIQLPRSFFRKLRTVLRKTFGRLVSPVVFESGSDGLSVRCQQEGMAVVYQTKDGNGNETLALPAQAITDIDGKGHEIVALEAKGAKVHARWQDAGVPRMVEYESVKSDKLADFPQRPNRFTGQGDRF